MSDHDPTVRLLHMRDFARKAVSLAAGRTREELGKDEVLCLALTHLVELVGEAASRLPREIQNQHPRIPWPKVVGMRNRLIHGYDDVDYAILWDTITHDLPELLKELESLPS